MSNENKYKIGRPVWRDDGVEWTLGEYRPGDDESFLQIKPVCRQWWDLEPWEREAFRSYLHIMLERPLTLPDAELIYYYAFKFMKGKKHLKQLK